jgi:hypothetical protein
MHHAPPVEAQFPPPPPGLSRQERVWRDFVRGSQGRATHLWEAGQGRGRGGKTRSGTRLLETPVLIAETRSGREAGALTLNRSASRFRARSSVPRGVRPMMGRSPGWTGFEQASSGSVFRERALPLGRVRCRVLTRVEPPRHHAHNAESGTANMPSPKPTVSSPS